MKTAIQHQPLEYYIELKWSTKAFMALIVLLDCL